MLGPHLWLKLICLKIICTRNAYCHITVHVRVTSIGEIDLSVNYSYSTGIIDAI